MLLAAGASTTLEESLILQQHRDAGAPCAQPLAVSDGSAGPSAQLQPQGASAADEAGKGPATGRRRAWRFDGHKAECPNSEQRLQRRLLKCDRCRAVRYCSQDCLNADWKTHKRLCRPRRWRRRRRNRPLPRSQSRPTARAEPVNRSATASRLWNLSALWARTGQQHNFLWRRAEPVINNACVGGRLHRAWAEEAQSVWGSTLLWRGPPETALGGSQRPFGGSSLIEVD